jgi:hypothetical protein
VESCLREGNELGSYQTQFISDSERRMSMSAHPAFLICGNFKSAGPHSPVSEYNETRNGSNARSNVFIGDVNRKVH